METKLPEWSGRKVLVVGDLILDHFVRGRVSRLSPEAPVPVVEVEDEHSALGGAANVAHNIHALGGAPLLVGVVGNDRAGEDFLELAEFTGVDASGVVTEAGRRTALKTRIIAHHQQVVRVDREGREPVGSTAAASLKKRLGALLPRCHAVVASDYAKGLFTPSLLAWLGEACRREHKPYIVDPKPAHFPYPGATVVTPNRAETQGFLGRPFATAEAPAVGRALLKRTDWEAILMTLGEEGMVLCERGQKPVAIPARVREVFDVTGAGDTVVATLALGLAAGRSLEESARWANAAAGVVVGKVGTAVCSPRELQSALGESGRRG